MVGTLLLSKRFLAGHLLTMSTAYMCAKWKNAPPNRAVLRSVFAVLCTSFHLISHMPFISWCFGAAVSTLIPISAHSSMNLGVVKAAPWSDLMNLILPTRPFCSVFVSQIFKALVSMVVDSEWTPIHPTSLDGVMTTKR